MAVGDDMRELYHGHAGHGSSQPTDTACRPSSIPRATSSRSVPSPGTRRRTPTPGIDVRRPWGIALRRNGGVSKRGELQAKRAERRQAVTPFAARVQQAATERLARDDAVVEKRMRAKQEGTRVTGTSAAPQSARRVAARDGTGRRDEQPVDAGCGPAPAGAQRGTSEAASRPDITAEADSGRVAEPMLERAAEAERHWSPGPTIGPGRHIPSQVCRRPVRQVDDGGAAVLSQRAGG